MPSEVGIKVARFGAPGKISFPKTAKLSIVDEARGRKLLALFQREQTSSTVSGR
jgi:hypothetical protein